LRKLLQVTSIAALMCVIWGASSHGAQVVSSTETSRVSQFAKGSPHELAEFQHWSTCFPVRGGDQCETGDRRGEGTTRGSTGPTPTDDSVPRLGQTQKQTPISDRDSRGKRNSPHNLGTFTITAYTNSPSDTGKSPSEIGYGITASGAPTVPGKTVAADWGVLPVGTVITIEGLAGQYVVQDSGSAVNGRHIDLYVSSETAAVTWGIKQRKVTVVRWGTEK